MENPGVVLAIGLIVMWTLQMVLSLLQMQRYFKRVNGLRKYGRVATAMTGGRYRGRIYAALAVDPATKRVTRAAQLSGWTVFAGLKDVPELVGLSLDAVLNDPQSLATLNPRMAETFRTAARTLEDSFNKPATSAGDSAKAESPHDAAVAVALPPALAPAMNPSATPALAPSPAPSASGAAPDERSTPYAPSTPQRLTND